MLREREFAWIQRIVQESTRQMDKLTKWEREFMDGLKYRFETQRSTMRLSSGQWKTIAEIGDKIIQ